MINFVTKYALMTIVLFSGYKGNSPFFSEIKLDKNIDYIIINSELKNAFKEDFKPLFRSGREIPVWFEVEVYENKQIVYLNKFRHIVSFDPLSKFYTISLEESNLKYRTSSLSDLKQMISALELQIEHDFDFSKNYEVVIRSYLKKVYLSSLKKEFDLNVLWRYQTPQIKKGFKFDAQEF